MSERRKVIYALFVAPVSIKRHGGPALLLSISENQNQDFAMEWCQSDGFLRVWYLKWPAGSPHEKASPVTTVPRENIQCMLFDGEAVEIRRESGNKPKAA